MRSNGGPQPSTERDESDSRPTSQAQLLGADSAAKGVAVQDNTGPTITQVPAPDWASIFAESYSTMYAAAASVLKGQSALGVDADDVVAIALREAITKGLPADLDQPRSYLASIARRRAIDALRRRKHQAPDPPDPVTEAMPRIPDEGPDELAIKAELAAEIAGHLDSLPARERFALEQTVMRDRPRAEVAGDLGVTPQRVSQLVNAALGRLRLLPAFAELPRFDLQEGGGLSPVGTEP